MATVPETMLFMAHGEGGPPEVLHPDTMPVPQPKAGEVLIRVLVAGVNRPEVAQRQGAYPPPPGASPVLGLEAAGEVAALGEGVTAFRVGDKVCALLNGGGYAEYAVAPATQCLFWPEGFDALRAAALPENYFTVWNNVFGLGRLQGGEALLVHGGSSGIGITAVQLGKAFGATVYATAGSAAKCAAVEKLGADRCINYREQDFVDEVRRLTNKRGVDVVLDMVGGDYFARNLRCMAESGRMAIIATLNGPVAEKVDIRPIMLKRLVVTGSTLRPRTAAEKGAIADALRGQVWPKLGSGALAGPVIETVFPLREAAAAHRLMEGSSHVGKIMLRVAE